MSSSAKKILFLNLTAFSLTGGIENFNRSFLKALSDLGREGVLTADAYSAYDDKVDPRYFEQQNYKGFNGKKFHFAGNVLLCAYKYETIIFAHIHLSAIAWIVKTIFPSKKIILIAHGIEVWRKLSKVQRTVLQKADKILAVSNFTKQKIVEVQKIDPDKITVFHNTIDPYFIYPDNFIKPGYLLERYNVKPDQPIIFTLTRLAATEKNKGYDLVIEAISQLKTTFPFIKYILAGKYDQDEKKRLDNLIEKTGLSDNVLLTGFIKEEELSDHYLLADVFILPSHKEGFGIVFIEAIACGMQVVAGNRDGSTDALQQGQLGLLIDPESETEIFQALQKCLKTKDNFANAALKKELQQKVVATFRFETYKQNLKKVLA